MSVGSLDFCGVVCRVRRRPVASVLDSFIFRELYTQEVHIVRIVDLPGVASTAPEVRVGMTDKSTGSGAKILVRQGPGPCRKKRVLYSKAVQRWRSGCSPEMCIYLLKPIERVDTRRRPRRLDSHVPPFTDNLSSEDRDGEEHCGNVSIDNGGPTRTSRWSRGTWWRRKYGMCRFVIMLPSQVTRAPAGSFSFRAVTKPPMVPKRS